jgi:hypothetical protein
VYPEINYPGCVFEGWYANENMTGERVVGISEEPPYGTTINVYGKMVCDEYRIEYHNVVADTDGNNKRSYTVSSEFDLMPPSRKYYKFKKWHLGTPDGQEITHISGRQHSGKLDLYAEWEFVCNERAHWLHIGEGINDKVCMYEQPPAGTTKPFVRVNRKNYKPGDPPYYMVLSEDQGVRIHEGSMKKMHVERGGQIYNVCDMSTCPPGGMEELVE